MQVGPIKYNKEEEKAFFKALVLGWVAGLPLGILLTYFAGFLKYPPDFGMRFVSSLLLAVNIGGISMLFSTISCLILFKRRGLLHSLRDAAKVIWAFLIASPVLWIYVASVTSLVISPLFDATSWLNPARQYWLGALVFLPFLFLFMLIFLPDQKPRKITYHFWLVIKREASFPRFNLRKVTIAILILVWLTIVFLPLPTTLLMNLVLIAGGLLVIAYLMKDRYRIRKRNGTRRH
jgi:hypothetical protein